jgi:drug/metabolite transporter (DMT)-like permease
MLAGSLAFALMGGLAHALGPRCDWQWTALARCLIPLLLVLAWARAAGTRLVFIRPRTLWVRSIAGSVSLLCTFFALTRLPVTDVYTLTNMFPIWVAVLSGPLLGEFPPGHVWLAAASGVLGVLLIQRPHLARGDFALLLAVAASFSTAVAMLGLHRLRGIDTRAIVVHFSAVALAMCAASFFLFDRPVRSNGAWDGTTVLMLGGVGVLATGGQLFLTRAFIAGHPAKVSVVGLSQVVFAMALDVGMLDNAFSWLTLLGIVLVVAPTAWLLAYPALRQARAEAAAER